MIDIKELAINIDNYLKTLEHSEMESLMAALNAGHGVPESAKGLGLMSEDIEYYLEHGFVNVFQMGRVEK